jgi:hypothetical protein
MLRSTSSRTPATTLRYEPTLPHAETPSCRREGDTRILADGGRIHGRLATTRH